MIRPTALKELEAQGHVRRAGRELHFRVQREWAIPTEDRLGYAAIVQMFECIREYHWELDIAALTGEHIDSITRSLSMDFISPVYIDKDSVGRYEVTWFRRRAYGISLFLLGQSDGGVLANGSMVSVFFDAQLKRACDPPDAVAHYLASAAPTVDA